nr:MAG TPA: hypothetical protein [Caudoviricetes sp.]
MQKFSKKGFTFIINGAIIINIRYLTRHRR